MPHPLTSAPALAHTIALTDQIAELRAELASVLCPSERRQIARELKAAEAKLTGVKRAA